MKRAEVLLRVERGHASEEELAALTAVLLALWRSDQEGGEEPPVVRSNWWRQLQAYASPGSWR